MIIVVNTKLGGARSAGFDSIFVHDDSAGGEDDHVSTCQLGHVNGSDHHGEWDNNEPAETYAHEVGHLAGLKDTYKTTGRIKTVRGVSVDCRVTQPCSLHANDKMATLKAGAKPQQAAIESLIKAAGLSCPLTCWFLTVPGGGSNGSGTSFPFGLPLEPPTFGPRVYRFDLDPLLTSFTYLQAPSIGGATIPILINFGTFEILTDTIPPFVLNPTLDSLTAGFIFTDFFLDIPPFEWEPGLLTGPNQVILQDLDPIAPSVGTIDAVTGSFSGTIQGIVVNNLFDETNPMRFVCFIDGFVDYQNGQVIFQTDICPLSPAIPTDVEDLPPTRIRRDALQVSFARGGGPVLIRYQVGDGPREEVSLTVFDVRGRRVRRLEETLREPGRYNLNWNRRDDHGAEVSSGIYFVRLRIGTQQLSRKVAIVRE